MEDIFIPVMESAMVYASHYCKATGRSTITVTDIEYALKYCAMNIVGKKIGSFFPEIYEDENDSEEDDIDVVDDSEEPFTRYRGDDELFVKMNESYDGWGEWEPSCPAEEIIKNAIDRNNGWVH